VDVKVGMSSLFVAVVDEGGVEGESDILSCVLQ